MPQLRETPSNESFEMASRSVVLQFLANHRAHNANALAGCESLDPEREFFGDGHEDQQPGHNDDTPVETPALTPQLLQQADRPRGIGNPSTPSSGSLPRTQASAARGALYTIPPWQKAHLSAHFFIKFAPLPNASDWESFVRNKLPWHAFWGDYWTITAQAAGSNALRIDMQEDLDESDTDGYIMVANSPRRREYELCVMMARNGFHKKIIPRIDSERPWVFLFEPLPGTTRNVLTPATMEDLRRETDLEDLEQAVQREWDRANR